MSRGPADDQRVWLNPLAAFALGVGGFVVGVLILAIGGTRTEVSREFTESAGFLVWSATIGAQTAFWAVVAVPLWIHLISVLRRTRIGLGVVILALLLITIIAVFPQFSLAVEIAWPLWGHQPKMRGLTLAGALLVGLPALFGIVLVQERVRRRMSRGVDGDAIHDAMEARDEVLRFLFMAGAVIGLAVLASGALRSATVPAFIDDDRFPQEAVLLYGAFFTGLLLLVYVPANTTLRQFEMAVRDHHFPPTHMPPPTAPAFTGWLERRAALETVLRLHVTPAQQLQASLFILTPLISAVLGAFIPES